MVSIINAQVVVYRVYLEDIVGFEEDIAYDVAPDNEAEDELHVGETPLVEPFTRSSEECGRAGLRGNDGCHHCPPGHTAPAEGKVLQAVFSPAHVEPDGHDSEEIDQNDECVDHELGHNGSPKASNAPVILPQSVIVTFEGFIPPGPS
jgi:hypothetical protein